MRRGRRRGRGPTPTRSPRALRVTPGGGVAISGSGRPPCRGRVLRGDGRTPLSLPGHLSHCNPPALPPGQAGGCSRVGGWHARNPRRAWEVTSETRTTSVEDSGRATPTDGPSIEALTDREISAGLQLTQ